MSHDVPPASRPEITRRRLLTGMAGVPLLLAPPVAACTATRTTATTTAGGTTSTARATGPGAVRHPRPDAHRRLRDLERAYQGRIGAFAIDTGNGATVSYRAHESFPLCSTFKAIAAGAVLDTGHRSDPGLLDRLIRWGADDMVPGSPITEKHLDDGLTVAQLCDAAIRYSDNTAGNLLLRQIGGPPGLTRYFRRLGDPVSRLDRWEPELNAWHPGERRDTTTPAAAGRDLQALTLGTALVEADRSRLIGWLRANTTGDERIRAGLPTDWVIGDKTGTAADNYALANDIAVAWPPSGAPLIMTIYTNRRAKDGTVDNKTIRSTATILAESLGRI